LAWAAERQVPDTTVPVAVEHWDLGPGESQVIAHGLGGLRWVVLDDLAARRCAASHGLAVIGSLGVVLRSKQRGLLDEARPWVTKLIEAGMFVDVKLLDVALDSVGER
jgi:predicted nucleic acid-binding protein